MKNLRLKIGFVVAVSLLVMSGFATSTTSAVEFSQGEKTLVYAMPYQFAEFSQYTADSYATAQWAGSVYAGLFKRSAAADRNYVPDLAASDAVFSDDGLTITVEIQEGLTFSTGDPLTAADVKFSYEMALTPAINTNTYGFYTQYFDDNSSISVVDDYTVEFELNKTYAFAYGLLAEGIVPEEQYGDRYDDCVNGDADACTFNADDGSDALSAGPFVVDDIDTTDNVVTVVRNDEYYDADNVKLDKIIFRFIEESPSALSALADGTIDIMDAQYVPAVDAFDDISGVEQVIVGDPAHQEIALNHNNSYYGTGTAVPDGGDIEDDTEQARILRQAMSRIIDRDFLVDNIMDGLAQPASTAMPSASQGWDSTLEVDPYNITEARELMESIGFDFADTDIDMSDDTSTCSSEANCFFSVTVLSPNTNPARNQWSELYVTELPKIGIHVDSHESVGWDNIIPRTFGYSADEGESVFPPSYDEGGYDMLFVGYSWGLDWDPSGLYTSSGLCPDCSNFMSYVNETVESQISNYTTELDIDARLDLVQELQEMLAYDLPVIPLIYPQSNWGINEDVTGYDPLLLSVSSQEWELVDRPPREDTEEEDLPFDTSSVLVSLLATASVVALVSRRVRKFE